MGLINNQFIEEEKRGEDAYCVTYLLEIRNFRNKLGKAKVRDVVESEKFFVNWSKFKVELSLAVEDEAVGGGDQSLLASVEERLQAMERRLSVQETKLEESKEEVVELRKQNKASKKEIPHPEMYIDFLKAHDIIK